MSTLTWRASERVTVDGGVHTGRQDERDKRYKRDKRMRCTYALPTDFSTPAAMRNDDRDKLDNVGDKPDLWMPHSLQNAEVAGAFAADGGQVEKTQEAAAVRQAILQVEV